MAEPGFIELMIIGAILGVPAIIAAGFLLNRKKKSDRPPEN